MRKLKLTSAKKGSRKAPAPPSDAALKELLAVREIAQALITAERAEDVFQLALERVVPVVGAAFGSVYVVDDGSELMRLAASHNWPERFRPWLGEMRVRMGFGPSGQAASRREPIEVPDVFADDALEDWQEVASELGFRALVAIPLAVRDRVLGALTFYFDAVGTFTDEHRALLRLVADQMAAAAEKASLIEELRRANAALTNANETLQRQNEALREARRIKDEFLANISHELRTPLTAVLGYIGLMQEGISGPLTEGQQGELRHVARASERLLGLIDDLLDLTTLKRGVFDVVVEDFDPRALLAEAVASVPRKKDVRVTVAPADVRVMRTDRKKAAKILVSLLDNAVKFTPKGEVTASISADGDLVAFRVRDTGIGIRPEARELVFEEFRQVDGSTTRPYGGTGLGLTLARRLARTLGGDITFESEPETGSVFTLELPREYHPTHEEPTPP